MKNWCKINEQKYQKGFTNQNNKNLCIHEEEKEENQPIDSLMKQLESPKITYTRVN